MKVGTEVVEGEEAGDIQRLLIISTTIIQTVPS